MTKSAVISVCGRANVGKSTLINRLVGEKISIVSDKPQTTRTRITGVVTHGDTQFVLLDTPGFHKPKNKLGSYMMQIISNTVFDADCILLLVEPVASVGQPEQELIERIDTSGLPCILVINKIDTVDKRKLLEVIDVYSKRHEFDAVVPVSAEKSDGLDVLLAEMERFAAEGPHFFPDDMITDQPERQICAEIIREKMLLCLEHEIPHGTAVEINRFTEGENGLLDLEATVYCEKASHKGIIIGKNGTMLKKIGSLAREDIEDFFGCKVMLRTWVKVKENWRNSDIMLNNFGFKDS
ncbi:MAG: GTPase Era [Oscillospiraceae bacterium]|nr:GTPase Era [Oscillospiraceae bacterium]